MRRDVQLFVNDQRVDLFDFEDINIVDSIQDVRDISKIFVPFSRQFTVPASKNNNKIFKHYYNPEIVNGFDARFKISAVIKINGQLYKKGRITLLGASLSDNKPRNYKIVFYDNTIDLKALLGDKELSDLKGKSPTLDAFNIEYNADNVVTGFAVGYELVDGALTQLGLSNVRDLVFPFISCKNYYFYDSDVEKEIPIDGDSESRNVNHEAETTPSGVYYRDLRGSVRLPFIITAIEEAYGITFSGDFFSETNREFNELYLFLQKEKGLYEFKAEEEFLLTDMTLDSGYDFPQPFENVLHYVDMTVAPDDGNDDYSIKVINTEDNTVLFEENGKGTNTFSFNLLDRQKNYSLKFIISNFTSANVDFDVVIRKFDSGFTFGYYSYPITSSQTYSVSSEFPKIKIIDFLTGLFNMFNLTAHVDENGSISVETLDAYYNNGNEIDITRYVDTNNIDVSRNKLYSEIAFTFEEASTFAAINSNEITNDVFGDEKIDNTNNDPTLSNILAFDGGSYEIKPKFEKIMYERMTDQSDVETSNLGWGWLVDKDQKSVLPKAILHYVVKENVGFYSGYDFSIIAMDKDSGTYDGVATYFRPSNSLSTESVLGQSLHFGSEFDEFYFSLGTNQLSLYTRYWRNYILSIYDEKSRIVSFNANLPVSIINTVKLNDVLVINRKKYRINKLDVNITTGKTKLELITYKEITPYYRDEYRIDSDLITIDSDLITIDTI